MEQPVIVAIPFIPTSDPQMPAAFEPLINALLLQSDIIATPALAPALGPQIPEAFEPVITPLLEQFITCIAPFSPALDPQMPPQ